MKKQVEGKVIITTFKNIIHAVMIGISCKGSDLLKGDYCWIQGVGGISRNRIDLDVEVRYPFGNYYRSIDYKQIKNEEEPVIWVREKVAENDTLSKHKLTLFNPIQLIKEIAEKGGLISEGWDRTFFMDILIDMEEMRNMADSWDKAIDSYTTRDPLYHDSIVLADSKLIIQSSVD